uniref:Uncharacterized protein n=1 Tax=Parascaris univalens TaxID=6257 RepID=A0A914ZT19_PARUN
MQTSIADSSFGIHTTASANTLSSFQNILARSIADSVCCKATVTLDSVTSCALQTSMSTYASSNGLLDIVWPAVRDMISATLTSRTPASGVFCWTTSKSTSSNASAFISSTIFSCPIASSSAFVTCITDNESFSITSVRMPTCTNSVELGALITTSATTVSSFDNLIASSAVHSVCCKATVTLDSAKSSALRMLMLACTSTNGQLDIVCTAVRNAICRTPTSAVSGAV